MSWLAASQDRLAGIDADLREPTRLQELVGREARTRGLQAEAGEGVEDDLGEAVEVADQEGEEADVEGLLDEVGEDVLVGAPGPEQARQRHVDDDQRRGQKRDLTAEQAEARIDVAGEDFGEAIDDAGVHFDCSRYCAGCDSRDRVA